MKKCPACNSTRYKEIDGVMRCARCGYTNKPIEKLKREINKD